MLDMSVLQVLPQPHGQSLPPWFPLMPSYWRQQGTGSPHSPAGSTTHKRGRSEGEFDVNEQQEPLLGRSSPAADHQLQPPPKAAPSAVTASPTSRGATGDRLAGRDSRSAYIRLCDLRRVFHSSEGSVRVAVEGLSLEMRAGGVTALLGHNGAGKTTTIHMLTGEGTGTVDERAVSCRSTLRILTLTAWPLECSWHWAACGSDTTSFISFV